MSAYYSSLGGHLEEFRAGWPILMYHKLGVPPSGTRLRGLYVSPKLFQVQLSEWHRAGGAWRDLGDNPGMPGLTITFDDGFASTLAMGMEPMQQVGCHAIQFLVPGFLGKTNAWDRDSGEIQEPLMDLSQVRDWLAAGHRIGAHTMTHPHLTQLPLAEAREEISASKKALEDLFGCAIRHFAYPYGDWNAWIRDLVREAGFDTAVTTDPGVNLPNQDPWSLQRYMARHRSRKLLQPWTWIS